MLAAEQGREAANVFLGDRAGIDRGGTINPGPLLFHRMGESSRESMTPVLNGRDRSS